MGGGRVKVGVFVVKIEPAVKVGGGGEVVCVLYGSGCPLIASGIFPMCRPVCGVSQSCCYCCRLSQSFMAQPDPCDFREISRSTHPVSSVPR